MCNEAPAETFSLVMWHQAAAGEQKFWQNILIYPVVENTIIEGMVYFT